jgi:hypothetical protein
LENFPLDHDPIQSLLLSSAYPEFYHHWNPANQSK